MKQKLNISLLKKTMYALGATQKELAEEIGIAQGTISNYLNGRVCPSRKVLEKIANVLGLSADDLLEKDESEKKDIDVNSSADRIDTIFWLYVFMNAIEDSKLDKETAVRLLENTLKRFDAFINAPNDDIKSNGKSYRLSFPICDNKELIDLFCKVTKLKPLFEEKK